MAKNSLSFRCSIFDTLDSIRASDLDQGEEEEEGEAGKNWIWLTNNNYINSRTRTRSESGRNPFPPRSNSF